HGYLTETRIWCVSCCGGKSKGQSGWCTVLDFREGVIRFLEEHPGFFCAECLASSIGAPLSPTTMVTLGLNRADGFATADDVWSRCYRLSRVIKAERKT